MDKRPTSEPVEGDAALVLAGAKSVREWIEERLGAAFAEQDARELAEMEYRMLHGDPTAEPPRGILNA